MSIWNYNSMPCIIDEIACCSTTCIFCGISLHLVSISPRGDIDQEYLDIRHCRQCGWWNGEYHKFERLSRLESQEIYKHAYGILRQLDLKDLHTPIQEVQDYLTVKQESVKILDPRLMEEVVGSVFRGLGYHAVVTNRSGDKGIDVILHDAQANMIGVQVKRYNYKIEANQIRELTGALFQGGYTKGIFVTTSDYQNGAEESARESGARGIPIELMNGKSFFDALGIAQLSVKREEITYKTYDLNGFRTTSYQVHYNEDEY